MLHKKSLAAMIGRASLYRLEIVYEGRTHNAEVSDQQGMDEAFADVFSDYNLQQRLEVLGYGSRDAYLEAEPTIEAKAKDMVEHYLAHIFPNGYKAQVVATSREAAVRYKKHIDAALGATITELETSNQDFHFGPGTVKVYTRAAPHTTSFRAEPCT